MLGTPWQATSVAVTRTRGHAALFAMTPRRAPQSAPAAVTILAALLSAAAAQASAGVSSSQLDGLLSEQLAGSKPNILVLFADDLGYGDLGVFGHPTTSTPNMDALAASGMRFTQWYSMLTGRLPVRTGTAGAVWTGGVFRPTAVGGLPLNETTTADQLKGAGYATCCIGKWHVGQRPEFLPTNRGFDHYLGIPYSDDMGQSAWRPHGAYPPLPLVEGTTAIEQPVNLNTLNDRYAAFAKSFIDNSTAAKTPFFLQLNWNHVHVPDFASEPYCNSSIRGRFGDALKEMDAGIGSVMQALKDSGAEDNTIVFFTSDNGPWKIMQLNGGSAGLFHGAKETTWEGGVREPGIVSWPGKIPAGSLSNTVVATYDIFPTALALAGQPLPSDRTIDGRDMSPVLFDGTTKSAHDCIFIYKGTGGLGCPKTNPNCPGLWATRCGSYKMHWVTSEYETANKGVFHDPPLLYNVDFDPSEAYPIDATSDEYQMANATIAAAVRAHLASLTPVPNQMAMGTDNKYAVCCNAGPFAADPAARSLDVAAAVAAANCTCNPGNFDVFVCPLTGPEETKYGGPEFYEL